MLLKIAWRNIWRSKLRSIVVISSIAIGVWSLVFLLSFSRGMILTYIDKAIENQTSHIQIHNPSFINADVDKNELERAAYNYLSNPDEIEQALSQYEEIEAFAFRSYAHQTFLGVAGKTGVANVFGINPEQEKLVTNIHQQIIKGDYFESQKRNQILISRAQAEKYNIGLKKKVILTFTDQSGTPTKVAFRVCGIYDTKNQLLDQFNVFVRQKDLNRVLNIPDQSHEVAILLKDVHQSDEVKAGIAATLPSELVRVYDEISPEIELFNVQIELSTFIFTFIFMLGLIFGIINTMLMAVLERMRELGMLMAIGLNKVKVFQMITLETLLLGIVSAPIGMLIGYISVGYFKQVGLDLSHFSKGMQKFGLSEVVYPVSSADMYITFGVAVLLTAILGSIYPALKAIRLRPVEAIRKV